MLPTAVNVALVVILAVWGFTSVLGGIMAGVDEDTRWMQVLVGLIAIMLGSVLAGRLGLG